MPVNQFGVLFFFFSRLPVVLKERAIERLSASRFQTKRRAQESTENETGTTEAIKAVTPQSQPIVVNIRQH